jgi:alkylhydroperoxidase/carboxymuconolactone decarboxylase family protein YurZ
LIPCDYVELVHKVAMMMAARRCWGRSGQVRDRLLMEQMTAEVTDLLDDIRDQWGGRGDVAARAAILRPFTLTDRERELLAVALLTLTRDQAGVPLAAEQAAALAEKLGVSEVLAGLTAADGTARPATGGHTP